MTDLDPITAGVVRSLAGKVADLDRRVRDQARASQARDRSVEGGAQLLYDEEDELRAVIGEQADGSFTITTYGGDPPDVPSMPLVAQFPQGATITWDGYDANNEQGWGPDFAFVTVHLSTIPGDPPPVDLDEYREFLRESQVASFVSPGGGAVGVSQPSDVTTYCTLVAWSQAGVPSAQSLEVSVTGGAIPETPGPTTPPAESPALTAVGFSDAILLRAQTVEASTLIQYHMRVADPDTVFVPVADDPATLLGIPTRSAIQLVTKLPDGVTPLDLTTTYEFATVATNVIDAAPPSAPVEGKCDPRAITEQVMGTVAAGFALVGRITVGDVVNGIKIDPDKGIIIPQPDGGTITFPANGVDYAQITAHVIAKSLTVENALTIAGTGKIEGSVSLSDGITRPSTAPTLTKMWPRLLSGMGDGATEAFVKWKDLCPHHSDPTKFVAAFSFFGAGIRSWNRVDGSSGSFTDLTLPVADTPDDWMANFYPDGGMCTLGGFYYIVGSDADRNGDWYLYKINGNTMVKAAEARITSFAGLPFAARVATDGTAIYVVFKSTADNLAIRRHNASNVAFVSSRTLISGWGGTKIGGATITTADTGTRRLYVSGEAYGNVLAFNATDADYLNWTRDATHDFQRADTFTLWGLEYDDVDGRFISLDPYGYWHRYAKRPVAEPISGEYTHADRSTANYPAGHPAAGTASLTHETEAGPRAGYTIPARAWLHVETNPAPDATDTDPTHVDRADRIGLYLGPTGAPVLQGYLFQGNRTADFDVLATGTTSAPGANTFSSDPNVTVSPGRVFSTRQAGGAPVIDLNGSGVWRLGHLKGNADGTDANDTGWQNVAFANGWVNFGAPFGDVQYRKVKIGNATKLVFQGMCKSGTLNATMFTLPVAYRPPVSKIVQVGLSNKVSGAQSTGTAHTHGIGNASTRATIGSDGTVVTVGADSNSYISFDGVEVWLD